MITHADAEVLKRLAARKNEIAALPIHEEKAELWRRLNDLEPVRPMVWINEIPWHEMNVDDELTLACEGSWARQLETSLRRELYQWTHMPGDMIVSPFLECPLAIESTGMGTEEDVDVVKTDEASDVVSRHFNPRISEPGDIALIRDPVVTHDEAATERRYETMNSIFKDIIEVKKVGIKHIWFTPWDNLIRLWDIQQAMMDLIDRPEMVNAIVARFVEASMKMLDQYEELNLLSAGVTNNRVGSGGYAYTKELPGSDFDPSYVRPHNMWGCSNAQIFSEVSPDMLWEFALRHDIPWLERWGMNYYGCCEPLDLKFEIIRKIPRIRKVSMSPWIKVERAAKNIGTDLVFSRKPTPAVFAEDGWRPEQARLDLVEVLEATRDVNVEIIMKDISTVRYKPQRLWEWESIAMEEVKKIEP